MVPDENEVPVDRVVPAVSARRADGQPLETGDQRLVSRIERQHHLRYDADSWLSVAVLREAGMGIILVALIALQIVLSPPEGLEIARTTEWMNGIIVLIVVVFTANFYYEHRLTANLVKLLRQCRERGIHVSFSAARPRRNLPLNVGLYAGYIAAIILLLFAAELSLTRWELLFLVIFAAAMVLIRFILIRTGTIAGPRPAHI